MNNSLDKKYKNNLTDFRAKAIITLVIILSGCQLPEQPVSKGHIQNRPIKLSSPPPPIVREITPPALTPSERKLLETYNVIVKDVDIQDLLFSLARDANIDVDISPDVKGSVTINAVNQTLPQILDRLSANFDLAYEYVSGGYRITTNKPVLRTYQIDYPNIDRSSTSSTKISTLDDGSGAGTSNTEVTTSSSNQFWTTLTENIQDILRESDKEVIISRNTSNKTQKTNKEASGLTSNIAGAVNNLSSSNTANNNDDDKIETLLAANVIANPESGIIQVRATFKQHAKIKEFLDLVLQSVSRQVLIEATIVEVILSQKYEKGIDWKIFSDTAKSTVGLLTFGTELREKTTISALNDDEFDAFQLGIQGTYSNDGFLNSIRLLEEFGNVKVLSSPKLSVLNNQSALLKVTNNLVYFTVDKKETAATETQPAITEYTTNLITTPEGFTMNVTPFISQSGIIHLNLRPSLTRKINEVKEPFSNNKIPVIHSREIESIMRIADGNIAVLGGLMQDHIADKIGGLPGIARRRGIGEVLSNQKQEREKSELVIFIRPTIIHNPDINDDYQNFREYLIDNEAFQAPHPALIN